MSDVSWVCWFLKRSPWIKRVLRGEVSPHRAMVSFFGPCRFDRTALARGGLRRSHSQGREAGGPAGPGAA